RSRRRGSGHRGRARAPRGREATRTSGSRAPHWSRARLYRADGGRSSPSSGRSATRGSAGEGSDGLLNLAGLQTTRAHIRTSRLAVQEHADALEVRVEAPLGGDHRVAPVVAEARLLPTDCADLAHRRRSVAKAIWRPARSPAAAGTGRPS